MKRTRRIQIIRYSRTSTLISNELEPELTEEQAMLDLLSRLPTSIDSDLKDTIAVSLSTQGESQTPEHQSTNDVPNGRPLRFFKWLFR